MLPLPPYGSMGPTESGCRFCGETGGRKGEQMTDIEAQITADEALARRLQQRESTPLIHFNNRSAAAERSMNGSSSSDGGGDRVGLRVGGYPIQAGSLDTADVPAVRRNANVRINVADDGVRGMNASRFGLLLLTMVNIPLIMAGVIILTLHWQDTTPCDSDHRQKWRWWALVSVVRMVLVTPVVVVRWKLEGQREGERNQAVNQLSNNMRNSLDVVGLVWFVIGHMWLLQKYDCPNPGDSPIYKLCLVYIIVTYLHICLPCIILILLVPVLCFCLPCVIRVMGMLQGTQTQKGARQEQIEKLPIVKHGEAENMEDESCAICLVDYEANDELRKLPCGHLFHKPCVDSWLAVNASCPNCRVRCFETGDDEEGEEKTAEPIPVGDNLA